MKGLRLMLRDWAHYFEESLWIMAAATIVAAPFALTGAYFETINFWPFFELLEWSSLGAAWVVSTIRVLSRFIV